ncbi:hypothetical protein [Pelomonas sp. SE-A7]|uniref:hypothetical protein n=1 Tax=Pelomonas sp. SE-A7 TaxID=3054953 RepID=UPI00259CA283|nr:hypothetical protein [Pelomonas sp. SE-A7]MDM4764778.1 hypothetical protein [Pelomonas sp. SE-A7]
MTLVQLHAAAVCAWLGLVAGEFVLELTPGDAGTRRFVAQAHLWTDRLFEIPLVALVVVTGGLLLARAWPASPLLWTKVGLALVAIAAQVICIPLVRRRARETDERRLRDLSRSIIATGAAAPFGLAALVIGYDYLH